MTSRERVQKVLRGEVPDSVPHGLYDVAINAFNDSTIELFQKKLGKHPRDCFRHDLRGFWPKAACELHESPEDRERRMALYPQITCSADVEKAFSTLKFDNLAVEPLKRQVDQIHDAGYPAIVVGSYNDFESPFGLRGREQFFMDIALQEEWLPLFLDYIIKMASREAERAALAGADIFGIGDDLGSQRGLLVSPAHWRELFKPRLKRIIDAAKNTNPDISFFLHSDGHIQEVIPDFIEVGVDILNPIQPEVMDPAEVKKLYGDDLIFFGGISVQHTLPLGTPEDVFNEVKLRMETIGAGGGYLMTPSHMINADIPWENIVAFFEAADKYGQY